ncbi:MAG: transposase [Candidatus Latescibacterota bacterium]
MPHLDAESLIQHVTVHLADSLPKTAIDRIEDSMDGMPGDRRQIEQRKRLHEWIDAGHGSCILRNPDIALMVQNTFLHFDHARYHLHAWVVMPNHFHVLFQPINGWSLAKIVASWKEFTARRIGDYLRSAHQKIDTPENANQEIGVPGSADQKIDGPGNDNPPVEGKTVWHHEYWDRHIRNEQHYAKTVSYIHNNPVAAKLIARAEDCPWSSVGGAKV